MVRYRTIRRIHDVRSCPFVKTKFSLRYFYKFSSDDHFDIYDMMGMLCHRPLQISRRRCVVMQKNIFATWSPHAIVHWPYFRNCWIKPTS
eukprot:CCRYP_003550-RA/>CCRYP_003550-RA protein AED:0.15 eAED:0.15 QI:264/1/0.5/1/0/0/2/0/89